MKDEIGTATDGENPSGLGLAQFSSTQPTLDPKGLTTSANAT